MSSISTPTTMATSSLEMVNTPTRKNDTDIMKRQKPTPACESCRSSKIRCLLSADGADEGVCERCCRLGRECVAQKKVKVKRRKRTDVRVREMEKKLEHLVSLYQHRLEAHVNCTPTYSIDSSGSEVLPPTISEVTPVVPDTLEAEPVLLPTISTMPGSCTGAEIVICESKSSSQWPVNHRLLSRDLSEVPVPSPMSFLDVRPELHYPLSSTPENSDALEALTHFEYCAITTMGNTYIQNTMRKHGIHLAKDSVFLLHAIQAYSFGHLQSLVPGRRRYEQLATCHKRRAIQLYRQELDGPVTRENMDPIFAACMLFAVLAYTDDNNAKVEDSFIFSNDPAAISWLKIQFGFNQLKHLPEIQPCLQESIWKGLLEESLYLDQNPDTRTGLDGLPILFAELCEINNLTTDGNNLYHAALRLCMSIIDLPVRKDNFVRFISFPARLKPEFFDLVSKKDHVALLIMSYWLSKMCALEQWWCLRRVRLECLAICAYLDAWQDSRILQLLDIPIQACGYISHRSSTITTDSSA